MTKYIKLDDAIAAFKKAEADNIEGFGCRIMDCFDADAAINIVNKLHVYIGKDRNESEN